MTITSTALLGVTGLLGVVMAAEGVKKFAGGHAEEFERFGYPQWFRHATGTLELLGGGGLLAGLVAGGTIGLASGLVVAAVLVGAIVTHVRVGDPAPSLAPPAILLALATGVVAHNAGLLG